MGIRPAIHQFLLSLLLVSLSVVTAYASADPPTVRVGVLAKRGLEHCRAKWHPTAVYLSQTVPSHQFVIVPLAFASVPKAVAEKEVDFILTNSSSYVELEDQYRVNSIATLINRMHCGDHQLFGGVIFSRKDRSDILTIENLRGKDFMAVQETSLGGWRMAWREMKDRGIDPHKDFKSLSFGGTHDAVVFAVHNNKVDAGTVRTDTLERMSAEGKIDLAEFHILNLKEALGESVHFTCSTQLYPEWPMARLPHTPDKLAAKVSQALFRMQDHTPAAIASKSAGWTYPLSYHPVHDCLKALQLGPYDPLSRKNLSAIYSQYQKWIVFGGIVILTICLSAVYVVRLNGQLSIINADLLSEVIKRKKIEAGLIESEFNLESALAAANEANNSKAEFLANMSHELRTPMNGIIGMTSLLQKMNLTDEQTEFTTIIMQSAEGLLGIINDILDYSHIEAGKSKLEVMEFDLHSLVNSVVKIIAPMAAEKGLIFSHGVENEVPAYLKGDARRLRKIVRILTSNAVKFTHKGTVSLHIALAEEGKDRCTLRIEVKDTGIGIAAHCQEQIFNPFTQVDYSSTRQYGGPGLGLALAKHFTEMMGGSIGVKSTPAQGSTFWFTAPLDKQRFDTGQRPLKTLNIVNISKPQAIATPKTIPEAEVHGARILVVEDNLVNQKVMIKLLGKLEYSVKVVDDGRKAVNELKKKKYDLVLMDLQMPEMNGYEAARAIRNPLNNCLEPQVPIIAVTANAMQEDRQKCLDAGMDDLLPKPVNPKALQEKIHQWHTNGSIPRDLNAKLPN